jgi:hypothetical protein
VVKVINYNSKMILILSQSQRGNKITPKNELGVDVSLGLWREEMF